MDWRAYRNRPPTLDEACAKLKAGEGSNTTKCENQDWTIRTDFIQVSSLSPTEDYFTQGKVTVQEGREWLYWGVFDGHSGWESSKIISHVLAKHVAQRLYSLLPVQFNDPECIASTIKTAFIELDQDILLDAFNALDPEVPVAEGICRVGPATSGSCALLSMLDPLTSKIYVACVGDSRAVLGRRHTEDGQEWAPIPLSEDQTGWNQEEASRIAKEHPKEQPIDRKSGRLLGCSVTRSFGDARWKWEREYIDRLEHRYLTKPKPKNYLTPPYMTAEPVLVTTQIRPGDVLVLGSDGFWNHMTNENAIHCTSLWIKEQAKENSTDEQTQPNVGQLQVHESGDSLPGLKDATDLSFGRRKDGYPYKWKVDERAYVVEDSNIATHLVKNAFGGRVRDLFLTVMGISPPSSKEVLDDTTVMVVQF
ncbi:phosphatase 2C-like domain-containing protein [Xylogone sp. PMI_703]|nr:phosphatase 2C-like domain-containing protein [Xylogone sp. PMI_703]